MEGHHRLTDTPPAVARFRRGEAVVGGGALLDGGLVLTCAHVVNAAVGRPATEAARPTETIPVDFPLQGVGPLDAIVVGWCPLRGLGDGDVALLSITGNGTSRLTPIGLAATAPAQDEGLRIFGFPQRRPDGVWKPGVYRAGPMVGGWQQLIARGGRDYKLQPGFSGCPVVAASGAAVGVFAQAETAEDVDTGAEIPVTVVEAALGASAEMALPIRRREEARGPQRTAGTSVWNVPALRNPNFTGREADLASLGERLQADGAVALTGLGGIGKSQLALQYAHDRRCDYDVVWWVTAEDEPTLVRDVAALAEPLGLRAADLDDRPTAAWLVRQELELRSGWLLIFDNAVEPEAVKPYIPQRGGHVLITSRHAGWRALARPSPLPRLEPAAAARLLELRSGDPDRAAAEALAEELDGLPLALEQAGAYTEASGTTLAGYLELFVDHRRALLASAAAPDSVTVATTWALALERLRERSPAAADLLTIAAFLAPEDIPRAVVQGRDDLEGPLGALADPLTFNAAVAALTHQSLVAPTGDALSVHRLVQAVVRDRLDDDARTRWAAVAASLIATCFPFDENDPGSWPATSRMLPHALQAAEHAEREGAVPEFTAFLRNQCALHLFQRAEYASAQTSFERALRDAEAAYGADHPRVTSALSGLASVMRERGDLDGALKAFRRALEIDEAALGPEHPEVAIDLNNLGGVLMRRHDLGAARQAFERSLAISEAHFGPHHVDGVHAANNLGIVLTDLGELEDAERAFGQALAAVERSYGPQHPYAAVTLCNIGNLRKARGDLDGARQAHERALEIELDCYGPHHPEVAGTLNNLATVLQEQGELARAQQALQQALDIVQQTHGPEHPSYGDVLENVAGVLLSDGALLPARAAIERAIAVEQGARWPRAEILADRVTLLARILEQSGDAEGAGQLRKMLGRAGQPAADA